MPYAERLMATRPPTRVGSHRGPAFVTPREEQ